MGNNDEHVYLLMHFPRNGMSEKDIGYLSSNLAWEALSTTNRMITITRRNDYNEALPVQLESLANLFRYWSTWRGDAPDDQHVISVPPPGWPTVGTLKTWATTLEAAVDAVQLPRLALNEGLLIESEKSRKWWQFWKPKSITIKKMALASKEE